MDSKRLRLLLGLILLLFTLPVNVTTQGEDSGGMTFIENVGQFDERARFQVQGVGGTLWLTEDELWLTVLEPAGKEPVPQPAEPHRVVNLRLSFPDSNPYPRLEPFSQLDSVVHYYRGNDPAQWHTDVPVWGGVRYVGLYPGVDLEITGEAGRLAWRLSPSNGEGWGGGVRLRVEGSETVTVKDDHLRLDTELGPVDLPLLDVTGRDSIDEPVVISTTGNGVEIASPFSAAPLTDQQIDAQVTYPEEAYFGSYLGGSSNDWVYDIAVSGQGDILDRGSDSRAIWVVGWTTSNNFPTWPGTTFLSGSSDGFVTKLKRSASYVAPTFSAYIGGSDEDAAQAIATDADGNAYVTGWTKSNDFATVNAFDQDYNGAVDAFVLKMDDTGTLQYASYLGGASGDDDGAAIAVGAPDTVYLTGYTHSEDFPTTERAYDREFSNPNIGLNDDTFVVKLDLSAGTAGLLYGTFIGGGTLSHGKDIAVDSSGDVYVTGHSGCDFEGRDYFPTTPDAYDTRDNRCAGALDTSVTVLKMNPAGNGSADLLYSTFLGGLNAATQRGEGIVVDTAGHIYVSGVTDSPDFPTTDGALDTTCGTDDNCNSRTDFFVAKLNPTGEGRDDLLYSTFLGGNYWEGSALGKSDLALGSNGDIYVSGNTSSDAGFPITDDAYDATGDSAWGDVFVVRLRPQGQGANDLVYGTYVGGSYVDGGEISIAVDEEDRVYVTGETASWDFPTTAHALYKNHSGERDAFVIRLLAPPRPDLSTSTKTVAPPKAAVGETVTYTVRLVNSGTLSTTVAVTDTLPATLIPQGTPTASSGPAPAFAPQTGFAGQMLTWNGIVLADTPVTLAYAAKLTSTTTLTPTVVNAAQIDDGLGNVYVRHAFVNGHKIFLPLVLR